MTGARPAGGFTLIEVLVALGIVAIALTAGLRATAALRARATPAHSASSSSDTPEVTAKRSRRDRDRSPDAEPLFSPDGREGE